MIHRKDVPFYQVRMKVLSMVVIFSFPIRRQQLNIRSLALRQTLHDGLSVCCISKCLARHDLEVVFSFYRYFLKEKDETTPKLCFLNKFRPIFDETYYL